MFYVVVIGFISWSFHLVLLLRSSGGKEKALLDKPERRILGELALNT